MEENDLANRMELMRRGRKGGKHKKHTLPKYTMKDIADAAGCSISTLHRYQRANHIDFKTLTLKELVNHINTLNNNNSPDLTIRIN